MHRYPGITVGTRHLNALINQLHDYIELYGYETIETPVIEDANLFLTKAGDQIIRKLFTFERYGHELALRPEFTAAAAYLYAQSQADVVRWQFSGSIFEDDPQENVHHYQRHSVGAELIGMSGPVVDAEIMTMAVGAVQELGLQDWKLIVGHAGLSRRVLRSFDLDPRTERFLIRNLTHLREHGLAYVMQRLDEWLIGAHSEGQIHPDWQTHLDTEQLLDVLLTATQRGRAMGGRTRHDIAQRLLQKRRRASERPQIVAALEFLERWSGIQGTQAIAREKIEALLDTDDEVVRSIWNDLQAALDWLDLPEDSPYLILQPDLARNWDYYTGIVFELRSANGLLLAGGGRYDELVGLVGNGKAAPAVGLAFYLDALLSCELSADEHTKRPHLTISASTPAHLLREWTSVLRNNQVIVSIAPEPATPTNSYIDEHGLHFRDHVYSLDDVFAFIQEYKRYDE